MAGDRADVTVIGGGTIGLAIAWRAAQAGQSVVVLDPTPGRGASWAAAGMLAPVTEAHYGEERLLALTLASSAAWPEFARELTEAAGQDIGYRRTGTLTVARDADDNAVLADLFAFQQRLGLTVQRLRGGETRAVEPALAPGVRGGILVDGDHQVDNRALVVALLAAGRRAGVAVRRTSAHELVVRGGRVSGVRTADGAVDCEQVVLAAGCWSGGLAGLPPEVLVPVRPVKGQLLHLRGPSGPPLLTRTVRGLDVYLVPRADGRLVVGATVEERGWDTTVTAGAVLRLLRDAADLVPGVEELELTETAVGLRPGSPDNAPLLGATALPGLVVATGHYRNGILLTPITAQTIGVLLATGRTPELLEPFSPRRFAAVAA